MADGAISDNPAVQEQLNRLASLSPGRDVLGLTRISELCARLGHPELNLPPVFHVSGTNGKGSTCAFLRAALEADGKRVHVYTSPHLVRFNERIRLAGELISYEMLAELLAEVLDQAEGLGASFFEVTTAAAFLAFSRIPADACVLEVGLGGRLDATNIVPAPAVCGIASLGIDHEGFLLAPEDGAPDDPLTRIGWEKAGIAKGGSPLVIASYPSKVDAVIRKHATVVGAPVFARNCEWFAEISANEMHYRDVSRSFTLPRPILAGPHQADNAVLAAAMLVHQSALKITAGAIAKGILQAHWPARLQSLENGPLTTQTSNRRIWLDGGHNADAGRMIGAFFGGENQMHVILGMLYNKDPSSLLTPLSEQMASLTIVPVPNHEWHDETAFRTVGLPTSLPVSSADDVAEALSRLPHDGLPALICGSLYLAGEVLSENNQLPE